MKPTYSPPTKTTPAPDEQVITSRLTTDGTKYLPETLETSDGSQEYPHPMTDPMTGVRGHLELQWPIGDPRPR